MRWRKSVSASTPRRGATLIELRASTRVAMALCVLATGVHAQTPSTAAPPLSNQPGQPPEVARPGFVPPAPQGLFQLPPAPVTATPLLPSADASARVQVQRIAFSGNTVVPTADLDALAAPYTGRATSLVEIETLRQQLTRLYVDRGYVNSGLLLKRVNEATGVVEFDVVEGRLSGVQLHGMERLREGYVTAQLSRPGDGPLNIDVLRERFQLLLADPLFDRLNARLIPGTQPGEAVLDIDVARAQPYGVTLFANNYRPVSIGSVGAGASGWVRNLTGFGDVLEGTLQAPTDHGGDVRTALAWRMPLNNRGTQLSLAYDRGDSSLVEEPVRALDIKSRLVSREIGVSQTLYETLARKFSIGVNRALRENRTTLLGEPFSFVQGEPTGETRERLWRFWQEFAQRSEVQVIALRSTVAWSRNNVQQVAGLPASSPFPSSARVWLGQAQFARQLMPDGTQVIVRGSVQRSPDRLLALDGMAIGGINTVRGYRENQIVRDQGHVLNVELEWPFLRDPEHGLRVVAVPFYDWGRGRNHGEAATSLRSAGLATRLTWYNLSVDLTLAKRLHQPAETRDQGSTLQDKGVQLQVSYKF